MNDLSFAHQKKQPWKPIPNSSQAFALDSRADHTLYHGARGPGKTDTQLMRFYRKVGMGYGAFWRGVIFDREYKNLDDLIAKSRRWFGGFGDGARFLASSQDNKWVWPTGEELLFRAIKKKADYWNYHGQEFPFIGWNELCKYPNDELYEQLMSTNRTSFTPEKDNPNVAPLRCEVFSTANPYGPGHGWVKQRFIDPAPSGRVVRTNTKVFDPSQGTEVEYVTTQVAIFGSYKENIYLPLSYIAYLNNITDENMRKAWLLGDWDVVAGGAFTDVWRKQVHVLKPFRVPHSWRVDRSFDWGSTDPAACVWWAEADGTEATFPDGSRWCPPRGSLVGIGELYTADRKGNGLMWGATRIADEIKLYEAKMKAAGLIQRDPFPGPADNQIGNNFNADVDTIEQLMLKRGVSWTESNKKPGSREMGLQLMRDRFQFSLDYAKNGEAGGPGLYFTQNCIKTIATVPSLPRDEDKPDDVDTDAEDHLYDAVRYRVLAGSNRWAMRFKLTVAK